MKITGFLLLAVCLLTLSCSKEKKRDKAGVAMQILVKDISNYSRQQQPNFILIPQNGPELAFQGLDPSAAFDEEYLSAVDGFGVEEVFYNGSLAVDQERLNMLLRIKEKKPVLVADYIHDNSLYNDVVFRNNALGFLSFPRLNNNYDYISIPDSCANENAQNIVQLSDAQNYLYLISTSGFESKTAFLNAISETNFDVVLLDLFFGDDAFTAAEISALKTKANGGKRLIISYVSIGSAEKYRYYWKENWKRKHPSFIAKAYDGYPDEFWVKYWKKEWQEILYGNDDSYFKKIINAGFDGAYLDNVEAYYFLYFDE